MPTAPPGNSGLRYGPSRCTPRILAPPGDLAAMRSHGAHRPARRRVRRGHGRGEKGGDAVTERRSAPWHPAQPDGVHLYTRRHAMHMHVDEAGQHIAAADVERRRCARLRRQAAATMRSPRRRTSPRTKARLALRRAGAQPAIGRQCTGCPPSSPASRCLALALKKNDAPKRRQIHRSRVAVVRRAWARP